MLALVCVIFSSAAFIFSSSTPAQAQNNPGNSLINQFVNGSVSPEELTRQMTATGNIGQLDAQKLVSNIVGNQGASLTGLGNVVDGVLNGSLNPQTALGLSTLNQLGKITNAQGLADVFSNPLVQQGLNAALQSAGAGKVTQQLKQIFGSAGAAGLATSLLTQAGAPAQVANMIGSLLGSQFMQAMGGLAGLTNAVQQALGGAASAQSAAQAMQGLQDAQQQQQQNAAYSGKCPQTCPNCCTCHDPIVQNHKNIRAHMTNEFEAYRTWLVSTWYPDNVVPALMIMTSQMTSAAIYQINILGSFLDAKHQLETQRLFQQMTAQANKDYQPSEGMCEFGTATRDLAASERRADLGQVAFSQRMLKRELGNGDVMTVEGDVSDMRSRLQQFLDEYCDKNDNGIGPENQGGLEVLCKKSIPAERQNKDIDYTRTVESALTLDVDFTQPSNTDDEKDIFALSNYLYANNPPDKVPFPKLANDEGKVRPDGYPLYLDLRSITAKRSVAQNSFAAIAALKSRGSKEVAPFIKKFVEQLGVDETEIHKLIGEEPSYFAQMEVLTKTIYEDPKFYADLYDKPANVERKLAAMEALGIMQDRDIYKSLLRSEAILAVYLESLLEPEQERVNSELRAITSTGPKMNKGME